MAYYLGVEELIVDGRFADGDHRTHLVGELAQLKRRVVNPPALLKAKKAGGYRRCL